MNPKLRRILLYICFATGIGVVSAMNRELSQRTELEHIYRRVTDPIIDHHFTETRSSASIGNSDTPLEVVTLWRAQLDARLDPDIARWIMLGGFVLVIFGGKAFEKIKPDDINN
ncbi:hypothetical protein HW115_19380 [Verrucomicrobiaceae bacterium N1E253]|uniref:Uncharacterized protein n=1 Tax=Oceaniferula marina TaxID=2748318 RepID=A0A851GSN3_9BACT|nr:hypothetical protein [Oceaniferula marina]NWK57790.1 hypothetical protein [Oceaniferula marina]